MGSHCPLTGPWGFQQDTRGNSQGGSGLYSGMPEDNNAWAGGRGPPAQPCRGAWPTQEGGPALWPGQEKTCLWAPPA